MARERNAITLSLELCDAAVQRASVSKIALLRFDYEQDSLTMTESLHSNRPYYRVYYYRDPYYVVEFYFVMTTGDRQAGPNVNVTCGPDGGVTQQLERTRKKSREKDM